ncbi:(2Fe-2S) ferredoxin domain-containing protein [Lichenicoccus sp.]|uniref:(2Fe-2S) ferredoxin domain-containing protein n=1 Tax=Lichenicoccus sp. TaxID=2781899 RepID=UPI003D0A20A4
MIDVHLEPLYRLHVFCCVNQRPATHRRGCCSSKGSRALCDYMCRLGMARGVRRIRINHAGCFNVCEHGPVMVIYPDAVWYRYQTDEDIEEIFRNHVLNGHLVERLRLTIDPATLHA